MAQRSAASDVTFNFGLLSFKANLYPTKVSSANKGTEFHMACQDCADVTPVDQGYSCPNGHGPFKAGELERRYHVDANGDKIEATKEEIAAAKSNGDDSKEIVLTVAPAAEVDTATLPGNNVYRVAVTSKKPAKSDIQSLALLTTLVQAAAEDPAGAKAFVGEITLRGIPQLARLSTFRGELTLQLLVRPSEIADFDETSVQLDAALLNQGMELVNALSAPFDAEAHNDKVKERVAALIASKTPATGGGSAPAATGGGSAPAPSVDLGDVLSQMLANVKKEAA